MEAVHSLHQLLLFDYLLPDFDELFHAYKTINSEEFSLDAGHFCVSELSLPRKFSLNALVKYQLFISNNDSVNYKNYIQHARLQ